MRQNPHSAFTYSPDDWEGAAAGLMGCGIAMVVAALAVTGGVLWGLWLLVDRILRMLGG